MKKIDLCGQWQMTGNGFDVSGKIPGSVYSFLLGAGLMQDPYYKDNELKAFELCKHTYTFTKKIDLAKTKSDYLLVAEGIDTLADIYVNSKLIDSTDNMHLKYEFNITDALVDGENEIKIVIKPVSEFLKGKPRFGSPECLYGFENIRKAYCMMGWDWGPRLPDAGIWRDIYILERNSARIVDFYVDQVHQDGEVFLIPTVKTDTDCNVKISVLSPNGEEKELARDIKNKIEEPKLWWPNGYGEQPLYTITAKIIDDSKVVDKTCKKIGLRTLCTVREKDEYGEGFYHVVNGIPIFAMGADYVPEDNILSRINEERSRRLLGDCILANYNTIRVWGGGYYPDDWFFDLCDELGLLVFMDMMFACTFIPYNKELWNNIEKEIEYNTKRLRDHACIAIISGNNEMGERFVWDKDEKNFKDYKDLFERLIPNAVKKIAPHFDYMDSSPTSFDWDIHPRNDNYGDCHYWSVWHDNEPFSQYRSHYFRYLSEFGFQSFPCEKTVNSFTEEGDRNIFSRIMERHQRNGSANGKILNYLSDTFRYPNSFGTLLYASQLLQAEAIRYGVEHLRRNRGRCMGTLYWQLNDIWPVASWASIDYYGRWKALHYVAKRFYNPIMISCKETGERDLTTNVNLQPDEYNYETKAQLSVNNDTLSTVKGIVRWWLKTNDGKVLQLDVKEIVIPALSVCTLEELDFNKCDVDNVYFEYLFEVDGNIVSSGSTLFTAPKFFNFLDPELRYELIGDEITVFANSYAKYVEIDSPDSDFLLSDNYFDMSKGSKTVKILRGKPKTIKIRSVYDIR